MSPSPAATFSPKSPLYWLCGALALGIFLIGLLAIFAPRIGSVMFGMPATSFEATPWVCLAGIRDVALGLVLFAMMALKEGRTTGILLLLCIVVPITDVTTVFLRTGLTCHIFVHGSSILYMTVIGILLLRRK